MNIISVYGEKGGARVLTSEEVSKEIRGKKKKNRGRRKREPRRGEKQVSKQMTKERQNNYVGLPRRINANSSVCGLSGGIGKDQNVWNQSDNCDTWYHVICHVSV